MDIAYLELVTNLIARRNELINNLPQFDLFHVTDVSGKNFGRYGTKIVPGDDDYETIKAILIKRFRKEWDENTAALAAYGVTRLDSVSLPF